MHGVNGKGGGCNKGRETGHHSPSLLEQGVVDSAPVDSLDAGFLAQGVIVRSMYHAANC